MSNHTTDHETLRDDQYWVRDHGPSAALLRVKRTIGGTIDHARLRLSVLVGEEGSFRVTVQSRPGQHGGVYFVVGRHWPAGAEITAPAARADLAAIQQVCALADLAEAMIGSKVYAMEPQEVGTAAEQEAAS